MLRCIAPGRACWRIRRHQSNRCSTAPPLVSTLERSASGTCSAPVGCLAGSGSVADEDVAGGGTAAGTGTTRLTGIAPRWPPAISTNLQAVAAPARSRRMRG
ncbi:hypothetical protein ATSB10_30890 [Dyella thiooxydans]|uniref:Uncharacterized protein n=1 Tax=Dyella thiooxydans TaxID=445710 RepID=A0A160N3I5_9GAMM|nr:hypothetical protein ATSB10_30890 [Dyella thiooxydans]